MNRVIVHLSDLHFGRVDPAILDPLVQSITDLHADVTAVSGDLTQRARRVEFEQARDFLNRLPGPRIVVPGNHDVPLYNPYRRFVSKWSRFREYINPETEQLWIDEAIAVVGVNTGRALTWKGGRINAVQIESVRRSLCSAPATALKVVVVHHPLDIPRTWAADNQARRAALALEGWAECGVDLILAGHVHRALAEREERLLRVGKHRAVIVQAGTATSTRGRGELNSYNAIYVEPALMRVVRQTWNRAKSRFEATHENEFAR